MARPLRKIKLDGTLYQRRPAVEAEIHDLTAVSPSELERRASICSRTSPGFVSPEVLVHFVRNVGAGMHRERLTELLLQRVYLLLPRAENAGEATASLTKANIRDDVVDHFVDLLLSDRAAYDNRLDYYEINFNSAIAKDRKDASDRHWKRDSQSEELGTDEDGAYSALDEAIGGYDPFDPRELDEKFYRLRLDEEIDSLPELQRRIVEMWRQEIPIDSQDPSAVTISKALGKSEKTIRTHRDKAFATLRLRLERKGKL
ncbi:sigma-70 family RNA polymerase sigma factor [Stutzerimonas xanthomarina]|uniref:Sigma-70 family RNA polymerase sigma factor n=1 Tax=Stutzerimonas xanthomarina TaxID=271420 RepID=A0A427DNJ0_9GAMM|nr:MULTISPECIES: sigma-70 family RNA polymerase sigma factor [Pseudomonadaceae]RRV05087.1 sigma-70 family RNA polymerase sigma factor [Stutzerimonas xanthomarina]WAJ37871.1 sigma-70 family RNA polymerase sigma factor [Pseudomonas sp. GOM7]